MSELAAMTVAVEIDENGTLVRISASTNLKDWSFWRNVVDQVWVNQVQVEQANRNQRNCEGCAEENL